MTDRSLYLAAYDISHPRRQRHTLNAIKPYARDGQKSMYECLLTDRERDTLLEEIKGGLDMSSDAFALLRLDPRARIIRLGKAGKPTSKSLLWIG